MVKVIVNGKEVEVEEGSTVLDAVSKAGYHVPTLCFLKGIHNEASCRMCLVELPNGKLIPSCAYQVSEGLEVITDSERLRRNRRTILELTLATHKMKCYDCSYKGGFCHLLDLAKEYGVEGIPVCAECPLHGDDCLLVKGEPCLGFITVSGCGSPCTREGTPCFGCRGPITREDIIETAAKEFIKQGIDLKELHSRVKLFWSSFPQFDHVFNLLLKYEKKYMGERT